MKVSDLHIPHARPSLRSPDPVGIRIRAPSRPHPRSDSSGSNRQPYKLLLLCFLAAVYVGFAVADGRPHVIAIESVIAAAFVVLAAASVTATAWLLVLGYAGHGLKDFWQERHLFVANTRWWPPFCACVDWVVALVLIAEIAAGVNLHT